MLNSSRQVSTRLVLTRITNKSLAAATSPFIALQSGQHDTKSRASAFNGCNLVLRTLFTQNQHSLLRTSLLPRPLSIQYNPSSRTLSTSAKLHAEKKDEGDEVKVGLFKRFKQMWKDYWYVMIPVHVVTSVGWFGGFYLMCKSGIDVPAILASMGTSEAYLEKIGNSDMGYYALAYACYKIATPARYTVTIGGTTLSIRYLTQTGLLKTSGELRADGTQLKNKMQAKTKAEFQAKRDHFKEEWQTAWEAFAKKRKKQG